MSTEQTVYIVLRNGRNRGTSISMVYANEDEAYEYAEKNNKEARMNAAPFEPTWSWEVRPRIVH